MEHGSHDQHTMTPVAPPSFHLLAKPTGARCNLACRYCFFLEKGRLYPDSSFRMTDEVLESFIRQYIAAQEVPFVSIAWQGGEPTLMGLDFFKKSVEYAKKYCKSGMNIEYTIQTNGTLLDDAWCSFFRKHRFLVGLSLDGPQEMHDAYRTDRQGRGTFDQVMNGLALLRKHGVDVNILASVHAANADHPGEVYRFFRDDAGIRFIQFIPIVEREGGKECCEGDAVTSRSVKPAQWGRFLSGVFDMWVQRDVGSMYVQQFDAALAAWGGYPPAVCVSAPVCGTSLVLEHTGDLYSCDHFVDPDHLLGNILETPLKALVCSEKQVRFGRNKRDGLPRVCHSCEFLSACHGGCPKDRFLKTTEGESGKNYLCDGYHEFFSHIDTLMRFMARELTVGRVPANVMAYMAGKEKR